jgi:hypothetical protein
MTVAELRKKLEQFGPGRQVKISLAKQDTREEVYQVDRAVTGVELYGESVWINYDDSY